MSTSELLNLQVGNMVENRINQLIPVFNLLLNEDIKKLFVTNKISDHQNVYINLWAFSENYICEAKDFMFKSDVDIAKLDDIKYLNIISENYDGLTVSTNTLITLNASLASGTRLVFEAFGENSKNLLDILEIYIKPKC